MVEVPGGGSDPLARALRDEWGALGLMSYHGIGTAANGETMWRADLAPDDLGKIRVLLHEAASELAGLRERLRDEKAGHDNWRLTAEDEYALRTKAETEVGALRVERDTAVAVLQQIVDPSYIGNYVAEEVVSIYRKWARNALAALAAVGGQTAQ